MIEVFFLGLACGALASFIFARRRIKSDRDRHRKLVERIQRYGGRKPW